MIEIVELPVRHGNVPLRVARGHFATNHSHINYYIDITKQKTRLSEAKEVAKQLVQTCSYPRRRKTKRPERYSEKIFQLSGYI